MDGADINSESLQAVRDLKSKFERLAQQKSPANSPQKTPVYGETLSVTSPDSPHTRSASNSPSDAPSTSSGHLRASSSASDIKAAAKRVPPPPPPPRGSKQLSPSPTPSASTSPLLRPVPVPPTQSLMKDVKDPALLPNVSSLKILFNNTNNDPTTPASPKTFSRSAFLPSVSDVTTKPAIPPRPASILGFSHNPTSADEISPQSSRTTSRTGSTDGDSDTADSTTSSRLIPPPVPARKPPGNGNKTGNGNSNGNGNGNGSATPKSTLRSLGAHFSDSSQTLCESDTQSLPLPTKHSSFLPPPPPPRHHRLTGATSSLLDNTAVSASAPNLHALSLPPPLPARRSTIVVESPSTAGSSTSSSSAATPALSLLPPPPPSRASLASTASSSTLSAIPDNNGRKPLGSSKLPPPPMRIIGRHDKLPPVRRSSTPSSDDDSGAEDDEPKALNSIDLMPDTTMSSRRPPILRFAETISESKIHVHAHSGCMAASGSNIVVGHGHHVRIFDLARSETALMNLDLRDFGTSSKDMKVTAMEFRPVGTRNHHDQGCLLWVGTKEGHIFEMDVRTGGLRAMKHAAHIHPITHIFRHAHSMLTLDESGKLLVFSPMGVDSATNEPEEMLLTTCIPRVIRTTEKQDFVKMIDGKLWTAARNEHSTATTAASLLSSSSFVGAVAGGGASGSSSTLSSSSTAYGQQRLPVIRVYDVFNPGSTGRSLLPCDHAGAVTSAAVVPSQPGRVYVGHEEGYISIWDLTSSSKDASDDGYPRCIEVMKVAMSDVLSLEGVNDRLWAGSRNGMISAYDVSCRPWMVTNCWNAHPGTPVLRLVVNYYAIVKAGRLCVVSVGRDEQVRLWDGLLGVDWVAKELVKQEPTFSSFRDLSVLVFSWNCDSAKPDSLSTDSINANLFTDALASSPSRPPPDVIVFGFQEVIDLESRKMTAKNVLLGSSKKKAGDDGLSEKVTGAYKRWYDKLVAAVKSAYGSVGYMAVNPENLVGLFTCIFVKTTERALFDDVAVTTVKRGMGGRYGNKGAIVARLVVGDSSICFINCHLAAGQHAVRRRNADAAGILEEKSVFASTGHPLAYVGGGDGTMILDHEFVIMSGDMNYRIDHRRDAIISAIKAGELSTLLQHDQLVREIKHNRACRLRGFSEGPLNFNPTYKYDRRSDEYDTSEKHRSPAWCDRILWKARVPGRVKLKEYRRYEANVSDHRPISAWFELTVKSFEWEKRERAKKEAEARWVDEQERLLIMAVEFYVTQALL